MKQIFTLLAVGLFLTACSKSDKTPEQVFPKLSTNICPGAETKQFVALWNNGHISVEKAENRDELIERFVEPNLENLIRVEPDFKVFIKPSSKVGTSSAPINWHHLAVGSLEAWTRNIKGQGVTVAVTDSGVDIEHKDLVDRIFVNNAEIEDNGIDDDNNGLIDDVRGYDFFLNQPSVTDPGAHGTHVAGIVAATHPFEVDEIDDIARVPAAFGIAPKAKILPVRFLGPSGEGSVSGALNAIEYSAIMGADIINASWGGAECSQILVNKIIELESRNILFVSAAGNEDYNVDLTPVYPGVIESATLINVAATSTDGARAYFSNFGTRSVDLAAPGVDIFSTVPADQYAVFSGTSMAAPIVSGLAALIKSENPNLRASDLKRIIESSVIIRQLEVETRGEVNIPSALGL